MIAAPESTAIGEDWDVVVIGAGPAGSIAALELARGSYRAPTAAQRGILVRYCSWAAARGLSALPAHPTVLSLYAASRLVVLATLQKTPFVRS